jgi:hypothetical protein
MMNMEPWELELPEKPCDTCVRSDGCNGSTPDEYKRNPLSRVDACGPYASWLDIVKEPPPPLRRLSPGPRQRAGG